MKTDIQLSLFLQVEEFWVLVCGVFLPRNSTAAVVDGLVLVSGLYVLFSVWVDLKVQFSFGAINISLNKTRKKVWVEIFCKMKSMFPFPHQFLPGKRSIAKRGFRLAFLLAKHYRINKNKNCHEKIIAVRFRRTGTG